MLELRIPEGKTFTGELEIKRSKFITWIRRTNDEESARQLLAEARAHFPDARHHCSAWVLCLPGQQPASHSSDDGEPSGTAGRPMLEVLAGSGVGNIGAVVIRYFGGTLLGTGGLVKAYSDSVAQCLGHIPRLRQITTAAWKLTVDYTDAGRLESELRNQNWLGDITFGATTVTLTCLNNNEIELTGFIASRLGREVTLERISDVITEVPL